MAEDTGHETRIHGDVGKLTQIGTVNGNVLIISEKAVKEALPRSFQSSIATDVSDFIRVVVKSNRFGRKIQFQVPYDITVSAFIDLIVGVLHLPWSKPISELMISFDFSYSIIFGEEKLSLRKSLRDAGISDGNEVTLSVRALWTDELEKAERKETDVEVYWQVNSQMFAWVEAVRKARGVLTQNRIKALADSCFTFVDEIGKQ
ncbi:MAG TPA: hypothetical protein VJ793_18295 [Anaerolineae bacterium]|nr:hypothetical protein [Anaerolineae bacterium]